MKSCPASDVKMSLMLFSVLARRGQMSPNCTHSLTQWTSLLRMHLFPVVTIRSIDQLERAR